MKNRKNRAVNEVFENSSKYSDEFSEQKLFNKVVKYGKRAGVKVIFAVLLLFNALKSSKMPLKDKAIVLGSLGYFIMPFDLIPDFIPVIGYGDDFAVLFATVRMMSGYIDINVINNSRSKLSDWFGDVDNDDLEQVLRILS